jgi:hypothetical protein
LKARGAARIDKFAQPAASDVMPGSAP